MRRRDRTAQPLRVLHYSSAVNRLRVGDHVYTVRSLTSDGQDLTLDPQRPLEVGDTLAPAGTIRVRAQAVRSRPLRRTPDWWGPWTFSWQEVI